MARIAPIAAAVYAEVVSGDGSDGAENQTKASKPAAPEPTPGGG